MLFFLLIVWRNILDSAPQRPLAAGHAPVLCENSLCFQTTLLNLESHIVRLYVAHFPAMRRTLFYSIPLIVWTFRPFVSLYSRQAGVSGLWCHRLERPAAPRRIYAVTRGFQATTQDLSVFFRSCQLRHYHNDSRVTITIHQYCLDTCGPCNN